MKGRAHTRWIVGAAIGAVCVVAAVCAALIGTGQLCITSAARPQDRYGDDIPAYASASDCDGDGIDDQTDILQNALAYVQMRPRYKSAYYAGGYPDDGFGVCTDVVAFALLGAGYDLQRLVDEDIVAAPDAYGIDAPDPAIDSRRARNLAVFFERNAQVLTTDAADIEAWQGGDVVVYDGHVGIVSDRRNADGVPYLIHHASSFQLAYEEDRLESYGTIIGHYRMGA